MNTRLVCNLDVKNFGAETLRFGDLNGDGATDLLFVQNVYGTREITCLTATTITGALLWQVGEASLENGRIYCDLPVQIYDWDHDGQNEVLYVRQATYVEYDKTQWARERAAKYSGTATMVVLDGKSGKEKHSFTLPAAADDSFLFADLTGCGRRQDLVVKDRYWNMWGVSHEGKVLWQWAGATGHFPAVADIDGDGKDEVFVGYALLDHDGKVLFENDPKGNHQDAANIVQLPDGSWRFVFGNHGVHCLNVEGKELWHSPLGEAQHVIAGRFRTDSPVQFMAIDIGQPGPDQRTSKGRAMLHLFDFDGREIWRREQQAGIWEKHAVSIGWLGAGTEQVIIYGQGGAIYDGSGEVIDVFSPQYTTDRTEQDRKAEYYAYSANVCGDSRDEIILAGSRLCCICANTRALQPPSQYNATFYRGM